MIPSLSYDDRMMPTRMRVANFQSDDLQQSKRSKIGNLSCSYAEAFDPNAETKIFQYSRKENIKPYPFLPLLSCTMPTLDRTLAALDLNQNFYDTALAINNVAIPKIAVATCYDEVWQIGQENLYDNSGNQAFYLDDCGTKISHIKYSSDGQSIYAVQRNRVITFDLQMELQSDSFRIKQAAAFDVVGSCFAVGNLSNKVFIYDSRDDKVVRTLVLGGKAK